jgi:hypothetical protein
MPNTVCPATKDKVFPQKFEPKNLMEENSPSNIHPNDTGTITKLFQHPICSATLPSKQDVLRHR